MVTRSASQLMSLKGVHPGTTQKAMTKGLYSC